MTDPYPCSHPAELGLLSSFLQAAEKVYPLCVAQGVEASWFSDPDRATLFPILMEMMRAGRTPDYATVIQWILDHKITFHTPVPDAWLADVLGFTCSPANAREYCTIMKEQAARKLAIMACEETARKLREEAITTGDVFNIATGAFAAVKDICVSDSDDKDYDQKAMLAFLDEMDEVASGKATPEFFRTGFESIDRECGGLVRGELMMVRGRSGCGKSLTAQKVVSMNAFSDMNAKAAIFTYEMPFNQYLSRLVADEGTIQLKSMRDGKYSKNELDAFQRSMSKIIASNIKIYDTFRLKRRDPGTFFTQCRKHAKNHGLDIVVLDHAHLLDLEGKTEKRKDEAMSDVFAEFKSMCLELRCAGIVLAQENTDGGTFGCSQASTHADSSWSLVPVWKTIGGMKRIVGASGIFCDKARQGNLLGRTIPVRLVGQFARIEEAQEAVREAEF